VNQTEAHDVAILARWFGWRPGEHDVAVGDGLAADAFARLLARAVEQPGIVPDALEVFEAHCRRLRGPSEAELVCEAISRRLHDDVVFDGCPEITAAFDRWQAARVTP